MGDWVLDRLRRRRDVLVYQDVPASGGKVVNPYVNLRHAVLAEKDIADALGLALSERLPEDHIDFLAFPAGTVSGLLAAATRDAHEYRLGASLPLALVMQKPKDYGPDAGAHCMGYAFHHGERCVLVDDVFTSGATLRAAHDRLKERGAEVVCALTVVHRGSRRAHFPVPLDFLYTLTDLTG